MKETHRPKAEWSSFVRVTPVAAIGGAVSDSTAALLGRLTSVAKLSCSILGFATLLAPTAASAVTVSTCTEANMCGSGTGACTINSALDVVPGAVLDCGMRTVTITGNGALHVTDGSFVLRTGNLTVSQGSSGQIRAAEAQSGTPGGFAIEVSGTFTLDGKLRANTNYGGGTISVTATGDILVNDQGTDGIEADGLSQGTSGGSVLLDAGGKIELYDPIHVESGDAGGGAGGMIVLRAGGNVITGLTGHLSAGGRAAGGGVIQIVSRNGNITLNEHVVANGQGETGNGGRVELNAGGAITINAYVSVLGGVNQGGGTASGGIVDIEAGCGGVAVAANLEATGGTLGEDQYSGGISVFSVGPLTVASGVLVDTHALALGGDGGAIRLASRGALTIATNAVLDARGNTSSGSDGVGGAIRASGCAVDVQSGATLDSRGAYGGGISVSATQSAPATGTQPLRVRAGALLKATGGTFSADGSVDLGVLHYKPGTCHTMSSKTCMLNSDCVNGCEDVGPCDYPNPDTGGVNTQFDVVPSRSADDHLGECSTACN